VLADLELLANNIDNDITQNDCTIEAIDSIYTILIHYLYIGSEFYIMKVKKNFLNSGGWCQELDDLKV